MPTVNIPEVGAVNFPDTMSQEDIVKAIQNDILPKAKAPEPEPTKDTGILSMTGRAIARGAKQTGSLLGDVLPAMAASAVGADEYAARQMAEAAETQKEIEQKYGARYKSLSDVKGIGDYIPFALETAAEQIPGMATALIPGAGLGVAGGRMAATAAAKELAERKATQAGARYAAMKTSEGAMRGQLGGAFLGSYALNAPEIFQNIYEETGGQMEPAAAALAGSVSAALDSILPVALLRQLGPNVKAGVVENLLEKSGMPSQLARKVVGATVTGAATEGITEAGQEAISITAEKFVQENPEIWGSKEFNRLIESSVRGAVGGGAFGAAGAGVGSYLESRRNVLADRQLQADRREVITEDLASRLGRDPTKEEVDAFVAATNKAREEMQDEGTPTDTGAGKPGVSISDQEGLGKGPTDTGIKGPTETDLDRINRLAADAAIREDNLDDQLAGTPPKSSALNTQIENDSRAGWYLLEDSERLELQDFLKGVLELRGEVKLTDIPQEYRDKLGTGESTLLTKLLKEDPQSTISGLTPKPAVPKAATKPSALDTKTYDELLEIKNNYQAESNALLYKNGSLPKTGTKRREEYDGLQARLIDISNRLDQKNQETEVTEEDKTKLTPSQQAELDRRQKAFKEELDSRLIEETPRINAADYVQKVDSNEIKPNSIKLKGFVNALGLDVPAGKDYVNRAFTELKNKLASMEKARPLAGVLEGMENLKVKAGLKAAAPVQLSDIEPEYETIKSKPGVNAERITAMFSQQMYGDMSKMPQVAVKEMLQNSFDGIKALLEQNVITEGNIDINVDKDKRTIALKDDGSGMTPDVLSNVFFTVAGTNKETEFGSGGFGVAKMQFLYGSDSIEVTTMRDGQISYTKTTGEDIKASLKDPSRAPNIEVTTAEETPDLAAQFPTGHGTIVKIVIPKEYKDPQTGEIKEINLSDSEYGYPVLEYSPLFANITVNFDGYPIRNMGSRFDAEQYTTFVDAQFDWGTARIYVSTEQRDKYLDNVHVLSNGLWQFGEKLKLNPTDLYGDNIPHRFYLDIVSRVKPEQEGYPFQFNRQGFTEQAKKDLTLIKNYLSIYYRQKDFQNTVKNFGTVQYLEITSSGVKASEKTDLVPNVPDVKIKQGISEGAKVQVKDGKLIVDGKVVPVLTPDDLKKASIDVSELKIPQNKIKPNKVMIHDNLEIKVGKDTFTPITVLATDQFGGRFNKFMFDIGDVFMALRDAVVKNMPPDAKGVDYSDLAKEAIGISFDKEYRGVSILLPFKGLYINPAFPEYVNTPEEAALGMFGTMIHELAHHKVRNHGADFPAEMQRILIKLEASKDFDIRQLKDDFISIVRDSKDIIDFLNREGSNEDNRAIGQRFKDSGQQARSEGAPKDVSERGRQERGELGLPSEFGPEYQAIGSEQGPGGVPSKTSAERRSLNSSPKKEQVPLDDPLFSPAHPTVTTAIANNDAQGALKALKNTAGKFLSGLADRLMQLNLDTVVGFDDLHYDLAVKSLDRVKGQKDRVITWIKQVKPNVYASRFDESKMTMPITETLKAFEDLQNGKLGIDPKIFTEDLEDITKVYKNALTSLNSPGTFFMDDNAIGLSLTRGGNSNYAIAHEFTHASTHWAIEHSNELDPKQRQALANLYRLYRYARKHTKNQTAYGYNNIHEFVAEAFSRPTFQNELRQMQKVMDTSMSAWSKFIQLVAQLFGIDNVLFHTLANADVLFSANSGSSVNKGDGLLWAPNKSVFNNTFKLNTGERTNFIDKLIELRTTWKDVDKSNLKKFFGSLNNQYRRYLLGALTVDQLSDIYGADMPQLKAYVKEVDAMLASRNAILKDGGQIVSIWSNLLQNHPDTAEQMGKVMIESTMQKMDPSILDPQLQQLLTKKGMAKELEAYDKSELKDAWRKMSSSPGGTDAVNLYISVRTFYEKRMTEYIAVQEARIREAGLAKDLTPEEINAKILNFRKQIEESIIRPYFPIKRFGDYFLMVGRGKDKIFMQFEDAFARDAELEKQKARLVKKFLGVEDDVTGLPMDEAEATQRAETELWPGQGFNEVLNEKLSEVTQLNKIKELVDQSTEDILKSTDPAIIQDRVSALQDSIKDAFGQYYLEMLPSESIKKMFLHRQNVAGPSQDMLRVFSLSFERIAYQRARFQHMPSLFNIVEAAKRRSMSMPTTDEKSIYGDVANELAKQFKSGVLEPPKHSKLTTFLTHFGFLQFLTAPASAIVNMMAIPGLYIPVAGARYGGPTRVGTVISKYVRMLGGTGYINEENNRYEFLSLARANLETLDEINTKDGTGKIKLPKDKTLSDVYAEGVFRQVIDTTLVHDSVSIGEMPSEQYTGRWQKFMYYASLPFHAAEKFNREISFMTSFELAYEKNITDKKMAPEAAYNLALEQARDLTQETMFNYNTTNKPRYFRGNIASVLLQFKMYPQHMCVLMFRTFQKGWSSTEQIELDKIREDLKTAPKDVLDKALADKTKELAELKKESRDAFLGMMGMSFLTAGVTGMPLWFIFSGVASAFHAAFGEDDEPFDAENWFKNWANRTFGGFAGDTISRGLLSQATGLNFADRMNLNLPDMWFPDVRKSQSEVDYVQNMFINTLGPSMGALLVSYPEALKRFNDGHTERAMEALMPAAIKNVMVGTRYMVEGQALTLKGNTLVEDISAREALSQMLGFSPERVAQKQQAAFQTKNANESIMNRRTDLLNAFFIAVDTGDADMMAKVINKMVKFSQTNPGVAVDPEKLVDSIEKRYQDRALANITGGMGLNKNLIPQLLPMLEYGEQ
jgi:hypothetical protein